ncbi:LOC680254 [Phodopus roborovskii]|uniref:LOC680254 protein n=1 Tax=Phodopus roborovskii TaxID=109678 RepID=A0AAU9ZM86_PHORO|nr:LOC680254 [Phodopus roborovskii]
MGKALPFFLNPFPVDFWTNTSFFLDEENEDPVLFNNHPRGNAIFLPEGRSSPGSGILRSLQDPRFAPCPPWSWICHEFRIAWLRCMVWMDGWALQVQTGQSRLPNKATTSATALQDEA